jgi:hypothetical protein
VWNNLAGATSTSFTITPNILQTGYQFRALFTNSNGSAYTSAATLTVTSGTTSGTAPAVTQNPTSQSVAVGATATFTAAASGSPTPAIQWQVLGAGSNTWNNLPGATSTTFAIVPNALQTGYQFRAMFTNSAGTVYSTAATLTLTTGTTTGTAPAVTKNPVAQTITAGQSATFVAAASGSPTPTVQWQVLGAGTNTWNNLPGANAASFTFTPNVLQTGYQFRALFANSAGSVTTSAATLTVNTAPVLQSNPVNQSVTAGSSVSFSASVIATPAATVQWQLSTDGGSTWSNISGATSTTYSFAAASTQNGNVFRAVFTNSLGSTTTAPATLTVTATVASAAKRVTGTLNPSAVDTVLSSGVV